MEPLSTSLSFPRKRESRASRACWMPAFAGMTGDGVGSCARRVKTCRPEGSRRQMVKSVVLAWGSLVWDPRDLQTAGKFVANGPLLPIEFCRISADGRLTLAIDESFGALCK